MSDYTDEQLILKFQQGDIKSYNEIVARFKDRLLNFINGYMKDYATSQNLVQDSIDKKHRQRQTNNYRYRGIKRLSRNRCHTAILFLYFPKVKRSVRVGAGFIPQPKSTLKKPKESTD